jgi:hypothetical protein
MAGEAPGGIRDTVRHRPKITRVADGVQDHLDADLPITKADGLPKIGRHRGRWLLPLLHLEMELLKSYLSTDTKGQTNMTMIRKVLCQLIREESVVLGGIRDTVHHLPMTRRAAEGVQDHVKAGRPIDKEDGIPKIGRHCGTWLHPLMHLKMVLLES